MLLARQPTALWLVVCWLLAVLKSTSFGWIGFDTGGTGSFCAVRRLRQPEDCWGLGRWALNACSAGSHPYRKEPLHGADTSSTRRTPLRLLIGWSPSLCNPLNPELFDILQNDLRRRLPRRAHRRRARAVTITALTAMQTAAAGPRGGCSMEPACSSRARPSTSAPPATGFPSINAIDTPTGFEANGISLPWRTPVRRRH